MLIVLVVASLVVALATWIVGWWGVAVAAVVIGALQWRRKGIAWMTALAAMLAWSALLLTNTIGGRFGALSSALGGVMGAPAGALVVVTLLFAGLLGWSAAVVASQLAGAIMGRSEGL